MGDILTYPRDSITKYVYTFNPIKLRLNLNYVWIFTLLSVTIISLVSLIGVIFLTLNKKVTENKLLYLVAFSAGSMLGGAFYHLLPESLETQNIITVSTLAIAGILISYSIEILINWRLNKLQTIKDHPQAFIYMNLLGDGIHNFIDGMVVAGAFQIDNKLGLVTSIAIIFHEIPQEIGDFAVLMYGGIEPKKALIYNLLSGTTAILGAIVALTLSQYIVELSGFLVPFAFGNFLYIAGSDLIPKLRDEKNLSHSLIQLMFMVAGVLLLYALRLVE